MFIFSLCRLIILKYYNALFGIMSRTHDLNVLWKIFVFLCIRHDDGIKHFNILTNGSYYFVQDQKFDSVEKVVEYFSRHEVPNQEGVRHVRLLYPIACDKCGRSESPISSPGVSRSVSLLTTISESNISTPSGNAGLGSGSATLPRDIKIDTDSIKSGDSGGKFRNVWSKLIFKLSHLLRLNQFTFVEFSSVFKLETTVLICYCCCMVCGCYRCYLTRSTFSGYANQEAAQVVLSLESQAEEKQ